ncbi:MAG: peptidoglycan-binding protein [Betaproteobacteria bacterium]|nr:MAG: peptidoglycan-binding protein [Betaproteobacteria bacterium]
MNLTPKQRSVIEQVINVFETGSPQGDYGAISTYADGPHDIRQITYGRSQTTEYGNLRELVGLYADASGTFSAELGLYADRVGSTPLTDDPDFKRLLRSAGRDDIVMQRTQDRFFARRYFDPAMKWCNTEGFTQPLSMLIAYDSFIHSGSVLWVIRGMFPEVTPAHGGDEKAWILAYVNARHRWLSNHRREVVRKSHYRTRDLSREVRRNNWDLTQLPIRANGTDVTGVQHVG